MAENNTTITWDIIRTNRNALLEQSDWTQLSDAPVTLEQRQTWATYRQTLRDLPEIYATPEDVVYPAIPTA